MDEYPLHALINFYAQWELFWPLDVTIAGIKRAANDE